ncbi:MAG: CBS domain-containing protein [Pirellulales bacterium]
MKVKKIMAADPACCTPDSTLQQAARLMVEHDCGAIPVIERNDHRKPVGIITDRDITCRAVAMGKNPLEMRVADCMSPSVVTVSPEASLEECCDLMEREKIRRILVVDDDGCCCGIVAQADVALHAGKGQTAEVVREVSQPAGQV